MALITFSLVSLTAAGNATHTLPTNASLSAREIIGLGVSDNLLAPGSAIRWSLFLTNVKSDSGALFTLAFGSQAATQNGNIYEVPPATVVCPASNITTFSINATAAITATMYLYYNEIPKTGGMTGT